jgi:hypothetical protein
LPVVDSLAGIDSLAGVDSLVSSAADIDYELLMG